MQVAEYTHVAIWQHPATMGKNQCSSSNKRKTVFGFGIPLRTMIDYNYRRMVILLNVHRATEGSCKVLWILTPSIVLH